MRFSKPRFSLLMLLVVVTCCAILSATIWQFWPRFQAYQARMRFESAARQFHPGMSVDDINNIAKSDSGGSYSSDAKGRPVGAVYYFFEGAWYFVYLELDTETAITTASEMPCTTVKTFRLAVPPKNYQPQTQSAKDWVNPTDFIQSAPGVRAPALTGEKARRTAYIEDFYEHISGRTDADLGIKYELLPNAE